MTVHPISLEDELVSIASALLTAAEADSTTPGSPLIFRPEWRPTPRVQSTASQEAKQAFSWASLVKEQLSRAGVHHDQTVPAQHTSSSTSASASSSSTHSPQTRGTTIPPRPKFLENAVAELLKRNLDVYSNVINHPFPRALGEGTASLDGFRYYMIQDWRYLRTCTQLKMISLGTADYGTEVEEFDVQRKVKQTTKVMETCGTMLGIPKKTMENTPESEQLKQSRIFYQTVILNKNAWLGYYVVLLPCVLTYWRIAKRLMDDVSTAKNVVYHKAWVEGNNDFSSVKKYINFINENIAVAGGVDEWNGPFNEACHHEAQIFNTGLHAPAPFEVVPNGTYSIHTSSASSLVLAVQDVTGFSRPLADKVLDEYLPSDAASYVVGKEKTGEDNERVRAVFLVVPRAT
ncbi:hypothetical protein B0H16DRAFT_1582787 [Mycena metata]|uniref:Thiaminase-2/PQQC domain-containing protein n=1 Tax=Mycena metata TaxID=1033252 RepID=A0AAD7HZY4_9AGAR|nr:hypothetical protein B0H16DRAFT_1582787 [Mycena metata]